MGWHTEAVPVPIQARPRPFARHGTSGAVSARDTYVGARGGEGMTVSTASERPEPRTMRIELSLRSVFAIIAIVAGLWLLARLWQIVVVIIIGVVLAGSFSPVVDWLERRRVPRGVALGLILLLLLGGVVGLGF